MEPERQPAALWGSKLQQSGPVLGVGDCQPTLEPCLSLTPGPAHRNLLSYIPGVNRTPRMVHCPSEYIVWFCWGLILEPFLCHFSQVTQLPSFDYFSV